MEFPLLGSLEKIVDEYNADEIKNYRKSRESVFKSIETYVKDNNLIIAGVMAMKNLLDRVNFDCDEVPNNMWYFEVYSPDARRDCISLANKLFEEKFPLIEAKKDFDGSYVVWYKAQKACKFVHASASIFERLPKETNKVNLIGKDIAYASIEILKIPILMNYINPRQDIKNWETIVKIDSKVDQWYPFQNTGKDPDEGSKNYNKDLEKTEKWMVKEKDLILIGNYAYQQFLKNSNYKKGYYPVINFYEVLSNNPKDHIKSLEKVLGSTLRVKEHQSQMKFHGTKYSVFKGDNKIIDIYDSSEECVPFVEINKVKYGNYHVLLLYLYIGLWISHKIQESSETVANKLRDRLSKMIWTLINARNWYLKEKGISGIHDRKRDDLFDIFQIHCKGTQKNVEREFRIRKWKGDIKDKLMVMRSYKPEIWKKDTGSLLDPRKSKSPSPTKKKKRSKSVRIKT